DARCPPRPRHDRAGPRLLGDAPLVGAVDRPLRGPGLPGDHPGLPRLRGGGRVPQRRPGPGRGAHDGRDRRAPRGDRARDPLAADHHRALRGRRVHPDPARPRLRRRGRRAELGAHRGRADHPALAGQGDVPGAEEPGQPPPGDPLRLRALELRVHQHLPGGGGPGTVRALRRAGVRRHHLRERAGQPHPGPPGHVGELPQRGPGAAAVRRRQRGQHHAAEDPVVERRALQGRGHDHRGGRVRRQAPPAARRPGLGGDRRLRPGVGRASRDGPAGGRPAGHGAGDARDRL
ncbi:MAG: hypothetical protein AVDCRST_MAG54-4995, partial [uncultured Actinomycetospora sp.]